MKEWEEGYCRALLGNKGHHEGIHSAMVEIGLPLFKGKPTAALKIRFKEAYEKWELWKKRQYFGLQRKEPYVKIGPNINLQDGE